MYLEKSLSCLGNGNRKGDESDEMKKRLSREKVAQVEAGIESFGDKKIIFSLFKIMIKKRLALEEVGQVMDGM